MSYDIRQSQVIHTWPSGAIVDLPELSLIMLCHDDGYNDWGSPDQDSASARHIVTDSRLAEAFKVDHFIVPPQQDGINNLSTYGVRFPRAQYCPQCGLIHYITRKKGQQSAGKSGTYDQAMSAFTCDECTNNQTGKGPRLVPMRFVIATEEGFLDDFPWDWYVHNSKPDERRKGHMLYFKSKGGSAGLADIVIESYRRSDKKLVSYKDLSQIFDQTIFTEICPKDGHYLNYVKEHLPKPWKGWHTNESYVTELVHNIPSGEAITSGENLSEVARKKFPRTLQRGAGNVIFPIVYSGILLPRSTYSQQCPPEIQKILDNTIINIKDSISDIYEGYTNDDWRELFINQIRKKTDHNLLKLGYSLAEVNGFIINHFGEDSQEHFVNKAVMLRQQEFKAFTGTVDNDDDVWFKKRKENGMLYNNLLKLPELIEEVVLLEKLSALKVNKGFTRVKPLMHEELVFADAGDRLGQNHLEEFQRIQDARKNPLHTRELPAVEVKGEGIFIRFNNLVLNNWSAIYPDARLMTINSNLEQSNRAFGQDHQLINKRYLFLHTFSHILLKELAEDCGYSLSSLSEIIYCSENEKIGTEDEMNGVLIYTTAPDAEGSLGGLVEKGEPRYLASVISRGVDKARWCSSDPLCISADHGQGFLGLNLAACFSCVLLPETSCEKMNKYLDRAAVIGTLNDAQIGLFNRE